MHKRMGANRRKKAAEKRRAPAGAPSRRFSVIAVGVVAAVAIVAAGAFVVVPRIAARLDHSQSFVVKSIAVESPNLYDKADIVKLSGLTTGMRMSDVRADSVVARLKPLHWISTVRVMRQYPDKVTLLLTPRAPLAFVSAGAVLVADKDGVLLPPLVGLRTDLPMVSGLVPDASADPQGHQRLRADDVRQLKRVLSQIARSDRETSSRVTQVDFSRSSVVRLVLAGPATVVDLDLLQLRGRLANLQRLFDALANAGQPPPSRIDLCYSNLAFVRDRESRHAH
jgi:cell division septal protein FtsQ